VLVRGCFPIPRGRYSGLVLKFRLGGLPAGMGAVAPFEGSLAFLHASIITTLSVYKTSRQ